MAKREDVKDKTAMPPEFVRGFALVRDLFAESHRCAKAIRGVLVDYGFDAEFETSGNCNAETVRGIRDAVSFLGSSGLPTPDVESWIRSIKESGAVVKETEDGDVGEDESGADPQTRIGD